MSLEKTAYNEVVVHETAHQWWYGIVGNNETKEAILYIDPKNSHLVKIYGLYWFNQDKRYHRLPTSLDSILPTLEGSVDVLAGNSTGGIVAFYSNTNVLKIKVKSKKKRALPVHMSARL